MTYENAVWSWAEHLRTGGTTPWAEWVAAGAGTDARVPDGWSVPGAAQLELVRRLSLHARIDPEAFTSLADLVLSRSGPGRGLAQQPLWWPEDDGARRFGAPAADPAGVPVEELVRVGVGALTELLLLSDDAPVERTSVRRRPFTRTPAFELAGAPVTTSAVRRALGSAGHAEGGRSPAVVLFAEPFDYVLVQVWSARVQRAAPVRWHGFVERWTGRGDLPPSADLPALARWWADRVGTDQVHVVVAPDGPDAATRMAADVVGIGSPVRQRDRTRLQPRWKDLSPAALDVVRRVSAVLGIRVGEERSAEVVRALVLSLAADEPVGHVLTVPRAFADWARQRAERMAAELTSGGYPVHGRLEGLVPRFDGLPTHPRREDTLDIVLAACLGRASVLVRP